MYLSKFSRGLLAPVGAQNQGTGLRQMQDFLVPVVDTRDFFGLETLVSVQGSNNLAAGTTDFPGTTLVVPQNEVWRVRDGSLVVTAGAGASVTNAGIVVQTGGTGGQSFFASNMVSAAASTIAFAPFLARDLLIPPGSRFGAFNSALTGVPTYSLTFLVERLTS